METELAHDDVQGEMTDEPVDAAVPATGEPLSSEASIDAVDHILGEVERALSRLDDGTYGRCDSCGTTIDDGHLAEMPTVQTCVACMPPVDG
jgi:RNA polymerase-binding transcription factor DksA